MVLNPSQWRVAEAWASTALPGGVPRRAGNPGAVAQQAAGTRRCEDCNTILKVVEKGEEPPQAYKGFMLLTQHLQEFALSTANILHGVIAKAKLRCLLL